MQKAIEEFLRIMRIWKNDWKQNNVMTPEAKFPVTVSTYDGLMATLESVLSISKIMKKEYDSSYVMTSQLHQDNLEVCKVDDFSDVVIKG